MIRSLSDNISIYISNELNYDEEKREVLSYGLQIFLGTSLQTFSILILAYFLNILKSTVIVSLSFIIFRKIIGGSHVDTYNKCYVLSVSLMILSGMVGKTIELPSTTILSLSILIYILSIVATILWIPAGTEKKMIKKIETRKKIKIQVMILLTIWILVCHFLNYSNFSKYVFPSTLGVTLAFFLATPLGYDFIRLKKTKTGSN